MDGLSQKLRLLLSLVDRKWVFNSPFYVDLDITERCNLTCPGCPYHSTQDEETKAGNVNAIDMDFDKIVRIFEQLLTTRTRNIIILGSGEPLLHTRFTDIIKTGKELGFNFTVLTNGTMINEEKANSIVDSGLDRLSVSLWDVTREGYEKTHGGTNPLLFDRLIAGLQTIHAVKIKKNKRKPSIVIHFPVSKNNFDMLDKVVELAIENHVNELSFAPVFDNVSSTGLQLDESGISHLAEKLREIAPRLKKAGIKYNLGNMLLRLTYGKSAWKTMPCYVGLFHSKIKTNGNIHSCCRCDVTLGNIHEESFSEIWNSKKYQSLRKSISTKDGLKKFSEGCICDYCSFTHNNYKIYRYDRFLLPVTKALNFFRAI